MSAYDPTRDSPDLTEAWLRYKNLPIRHRGGLHGIFKAGWDAARAPKVLDGRAPRQCSGCGNWCLYDGWDHTHANGIGIESCTQSEPVQVSREEIAVLISGAPFPSKRSLAKADAILTLLGRETVQDDDTEMEGP